MIFSTAVITSTFSQSAVNYGLDLSAVFARTIPAITPIAARERYLVKARAKDSEAFLLSL
jgi:hypothetical protein